MKKSLLTVIGLATLGTAFAQVPSPSWTISQNAGFPIPSAGIRFMDAVDQNVAWVSGYDGTAPSRNYNWVSRTTNGGTSWSSNVVWTGTNTVVGDTNVYVMANLEGIDANTAWVSAYKKPGEKGGIFRTINGGTSWQNMTAAGMYTNSAAFCNLVCFVTPLVGITQGDPIGASLEFEIWRTVDGGTTWSQIPGANIPNPNNVNEYGIVNVYTKQGNNNIWFGTNQGRIFYSNDAGLTWNVSQVPTSNNPSAYITDIAFTSPLNGVATVIISGSATFEMYNTTDGGVTWTAITPVSASVGRNELSVVPGTNYLVSAGAGTGNTLISYSSDNGVTWTDWGSTGIQYLTIDFSDASTGWAGGFSDPANAADGGIWKYNGPTLVSGSLPPTSNFSLPAVICSAGASTTVTPTENSTGTAPLSYSWSASAGVAFSSSTIPTPVITFTANGTYTVMLEVTNTVTSNISWQIVNVSTCSTPSAGFSLPTATTLCNSLVHTFTNTSTGSPTPTYTWSTSPSTGVNITPSAFATNASISFTAPGVYSVTLLASNAQGTNAVTQTVTIANCAPNASFVLPAQTCTGTALTMTNTTSTAFGANTYSWSVVPSPGSISNVTAPSPTITFANANTYTVTLKATNNSGSTTLSQTITVNTCVGIAENSVLSAFIDVYPNPATDHVSVKMPAGFQDAYSLTLTNLLGKVVYVENVSNKENATIRLTGLSKGIYFLTAESKGQKATRKVVVE
jgi:PKD repeat protein